MSGQNSKDHRVIEASWEILMVAVGSVLLCALAGFVLHLAWICFRFGWTLVNR